MKHPLLFSLPLLLSVLWTGCQELPSEPSPAPTQNSRAISCTQNNECTESNTCQDGFCRTPCAEENPCENASTSCAEDLGYCVECARDLNCRTGLCDRGFCVESECQLDSQCQENEACNAGRCTLLPEPDPPCIHNRCAGEQLIVCNEEGQEEPPAPCPGNTYCQENGEEARCVERQICTPLSSSCENLRTQRTCNENGTGYHETTCGFHGICLGRECSFLGSGDLVIDLEWKTSLSRGLPALHLLDTSIRGSGWNSAPGDELYELHYAEEYTDLYPYPGVALDRYLEDKHYRIGVDTEHVHLDEPSGSATMSLIIWVQGEMVYRQEKVMEANQFWEVGDLFGGDSPHFEAIDSVTRGLPTWECLADTHCPDGTCVDETCTPCNQDSECFDDEMCIDGTCLECTFDEHCPHGTCSPDGACIPCTEDSHCPENHVCFEVRQECVSEDTCWFDSAEPNNRYGERSPSVVDISPDEVFSVCNDDVDLFVSGDLMFRPADEIIIEYTPTNATLTADINDVLDPRYLETQVEGENGTLVIPYNILRTQEVRLRTSNSTAVRYTIRLEGEGGY